MVTRTAILSATQPPFVWYRQGVVESHLFASAGDSLEPKYGNFIPHCLPVFFFCLPVNAISRVYVRRTLKLKVLFYKVLFYKVFITCLPFCSACAQNLSLIQCVSFSSTISLCNLCRVWYESLGYNISQLLSPECARAEGRVCPSFCSPYDANRLPSEPLFAQKGSSVYNGGVPVGASGNMKHGSCSVQSTGRKSLSVRLLLLREGGLIRFCSLHCEQRN